MKRSSPRRQRPATTESPRGILSSSANQSTTTDAEDLNTPTPTQRRRMIEELFSVVLESAQGQGLSAAQSRQAFRHAAQQLQRSPYRPKPSSPFARMRQIGDLLESWYCDADYLSATGTPAALPLSGERSLATLVERHVPTLPVRALVAFLQDQKLLKAESNGTFRPTRRTAAFGTQNPMSLDRIPVLVHALMGTITHNLNPVTRKTGTRCERGASIEGIPRQHLRSFHDHAKRLAQSYLNELAVWARRYQTQLTRASDRPARVGLEVFTYVEEEAPSRVRPPRRARP